MFTPTEIHDAYSGAVLEHLSPASAQRMRPFVEACRAVFVAGIRAEETDGWADLLDLARKGAEAELQALQEMWVGQPESEDLASEKQAVIVLLKNAIHPEELVALTAG